MGTLLNKVLKDIVVRSLTMAGFDSPYVPGWDCHGLPIEHKVVKDLGSKAQGMSHAQIRSLCHTEAMKWVDVQRRQFMRLGVLGDWPHPYLTLDPRYEAGILDVLADLVEQGYVDRQLKPIHWCITDRTALAEAELEYQEASTPSIFVNFAIVSGRACSLGRRRAVERDDLDDHAVDAARQRRGGRASRPRIRRDPLYRSRDRRSDPDDPRRRAGGEGDGATRDRVYRGRPLPRPGPRRRALSPPVHRPRRARSCWPSMSASRTAPGWCTPPPGMVRKTTRPAGRTGFPS